MAMVVPYEKRMRRAALGLPRAARRIIVMTLVVAAARPGLAAETLRTNDGLSAVARGAALTAVRLDGRALPEVRVEASVVDPRTGVAAPAGMSVSGSWHPLPGCLRLTGEVRAAGTDDRAADLVLRVSGARLALGSMERNPLLQPARLLSKLPLVSLRAAGGDRLALAIPPDSLALYEFRERGEAVELRFPFGFTAEARPALRMRAPFSVVLYRTDPRWHFRSALARYYALFPEPFRPFARDQGGWFFAAETRQLPNPQHFAYHEGGPAGWQEDLERGMGTYPYRESSSATVALPGSNLPHSYAEAMERLAALEQQVSPADWRAQQSCGLDAEVRRSGQRALLADSRPSGAWAGAAQSMILGRPFSGPILVRGFSRAEGVTGGRDKDYSIYADVVYADGGYLFGQCATFSTGSHGWEESRCVIQPERPVAELRVYCLLRGHVGRAWFDDVYVGPVEAPHTNWLRNPGFETNEPRRDLRYIADNVCINPRGQRVVAITDNLSADVGPDQPMNLLRFTLNVDPGIPSTPEHPAVAATEMAYYDSVFRNYPGVKGCYIDSVSAWCYGVLNARREHWRYATAPFTYDPESLRVAAPGRFAMTSYLRALQKRYHPLGKAIFTNIHVNLEAFSLYLVSDVPGIESSLFDDQDSMFFYRASAYQKPLLLLNFMNLHGLDRREVAERYHRNAAQWGHFPSTGRFVERAYQEYGEVTHAYLPAIREISAAGWQPIAHAHGARVERFGGTGAAYFTVRGSGAGARQVLSVAPEALGLARRAALPRGMSAFDAVRLNELPLVPERGSSGWRIPVVIGGDSVQILRVGPRSGVAEWLVHRAYTHAMGASRVRGRAGVTPEIRRLSASLARPLRAGAPLQARLAEWQRLLEEALASVQGPQGDLFVTSQRRELLQARHALSELTVLAVGATPRIDGPRLGYPGQTLRWAARMPAGVRLVSFGVRPGPAAVPLLEGVARRDRTPAPALQYLAREPGPLTVQAVFEVALPGQEPWQVERVAEMFIRPSLTLRLSAGVVDGTARRFMVRAERSTPDVRCTLHASVEPLADVTPPSVAPDRAGRAWFQVRRAADGLRRVVAVVARDGQGRELARVHSEPYWDEPDPPAGNRALAASGAHCTTDTCFADYTPAPLLDGVIHVAGRHWTEQAWASADSGEPHWVQVDLPRPSSVREIWLYWALDGGRAWTSCRYALRGLVEGTWRTLAQVDHEQERSFSRHPIGPVTISALRIEQPPKGGPSDRPGILWLREVCLVR